MQLFVLKGPQLELQVVVVFVAIFHVMHMTERLSHDRKVIAKKKTLRLQIPLRLDGA